MSTFSWTLPSIEDSEDLIFIDTDHETEALSRLKYQFRDKINIRAALAAIVGPTQGIEDAMQDLLTERNIDTAVGVQLNALGLIVGQPRGGLDDDTYRRYIRARIARNRSNGTVEDLIRVAVLILGSETAYVQVDQQHPASVVVRIYNIDVPDDIAQVVIQFLRGTVSGGVRIILEYSNDVENIFTWDIDAWDDGKHFMNAIT